MSQSDASGSSRHGNLQKHTNPNKLQQTLIDTFHTKIVALIKQTQTQALLDAGCGEGFLLQFIRQSGLDIDYTGSDISLTALTWSRENLFADLRANVADVHHLPYADNAFPLVMCLEVLEHIPDSAIGLRELARVSSDYIIVSVPHEPFFRGANFLRGKHISDFGNDPEHIHNYNGRSFRSMVSTVADIVWHGYSFPWQIALLKKRPQ